MIHELKNANYEEVPIAVLPPVTKLEECGRYEIQFKDGVVPDELRKRADMTELAMQSCYHFSIYPDESLLTHLKIKPHGEMSVVLNVLTPTPESPAAHVIGNVEIPLSVEEVKLVESKLLFDRLYDHITHLPANETLEIKGFGDCDVDLTITKDECYKAENESYEEYKERLENEGAEISSTEEEFDDVMSEWNLVQLTVKKDGKLIGDTNDIHVDELYGLFSDIRDGSALVGKENLISENVNGQDGKCIADIVKAMEKDKNISYDV